jgi:SAM-dependent methyltransferase
MLRLQETLTYQQDGRLLELGFGGGGFLSLASRYFDTLGIDHSERRLAKIWPNLTARMRVMGGDIEQEKLGQDLYDVVAAFNILEHLHRPAGTVEKVHRGLRPGGILIGSVPNNQGMVGRIATTLTNLGDRTHVSTYPPADWHRIFQSAGFREVVFFGELLLTQFLAVYLKGPLWKHYAFNLIFVCRK